MRRLAVLVPILVPFTIAHAAPVPKDADASVLYYATTVGSKWVYQAGKDELRVLEVRAVKEKGGEVTVTVGTVVDGKVTTDQSVLVSSQGVFSAEPADKVPNPLLKLPAKPKDKWDWTTAWGKGTRTIAGAEEVEVPAGKFKAIRVEAELTLFPNVIGRTATIKMTEWYAPSVGPVKRVSRDDRDERTEVLKEFTPGKP
jgi:hypothetical protein